MIEPIWFLIGAVAPALLAAGALYLTTRPAVAGKWLCPNAAWSFAVGLGFACTFWATDGLPPIPARESHQWLIVLLVPCALLADLIGGWGSIGRWFGWILRAVLFLGWAPLLLQSYIKYTWSHQEAIAWLTGLSVFGLLQFVVVGGLAHKGRQRLVIFCVGLITAMSGILIMLSGSTTLGQLSLGLACALAGGWVVLLLQPKIIPTTGMVVVVILLLGLWTNGHFYAELTPLHAVCLAISPVGIWMAKIPAIKKRSAYIQVAIAVVSVLVPLSIAATDAAIAFAAEMNQPATPY